MPGRPDILVFEDVSEQAEAAAVIFRDSCKSALAGKGLFTVALSGGKTPAGLYSALSAPRFKDAIPWEKIHLFWGDERCVPPVSAESNYRTAFVNLISKTDIPVKNVHRIHGEIDPVTAASIYEGELNFFFKPSAIPVFDLVLLGLGEDGHTLSLFPSSAASMERKRLVMAAKDPHGLWRVTMTLKAVNNASKAVFLVSGGAKAAILKEVLEGKTRYPASGICPSNGEIIWLVDKEAAKLL